MNSAPNRPPPSAALTCRETLSCMLDGELDAAACIQLMETLRTDEQARREWMLMAAAGDALRSTDVAAWHSAAFVARMAAALADEPAIVAPPRVAHRRFVRRIVLPGAAVAAAFTVLGIFAVPQLRSNATATFTATVTPAAPAAVVPPEVTAELEDYVVAHREAAGGAVMPRSAAYLRTANTPTAAPAAAPR